MRIHLQKSVASPAHYAEASANYNSEVPLSADRTFAGLRGSIIVAESNHPLEAPASTAASMGFAAATKSLFDPTEEIRSLQAQLASLQLSAGGTKAGKQPLRHGTPYPALLLDTWYVRPPQLGLHVSEPGP